ncbi:hypothetical protein D3C75_863860 [compost metagenome]
MQIAVGLRRKPGLDAGDAAFLEVVHHNGFDKIGCGAFALHRNLFSYGLIMSTFYVCSIIHKFVREYIEGYSHVTYCSLLPSTKAGGDSPENSLGAADRCLFASGRMHRNRAG